MPKTENMLATSDSADRDRSEIITVSTPRGAVDVAHQQMRGLNQRAGWQRSWLARRAGTHRWVKATTAEEAIRKVLLVSAGKRPPWVRAAAAEAQRRLPVDPEATVGTDPTGPTGGR